MKRIPFNDGWMFSQAGGLLSAMGGGAASKPVTLPHDAMIAGERRPDCADGPDTAWYAGATYVYTRQLEAPAEWASLPVLLELEGVCRNAMVFVDGQFAGKHPGAYTGFRVDIGRFLNYGGVSELRVEVKNGMGHTSRWYSGGGIYRPAWLLVGAENQIAPDGVRVETLQCDNALAAVSYAVTLERHAVGRRRLRARFTLMDESGCVAARDEQPVTLFGKERVVVRGRVDVPRPKLWSVDAPHLYTAAVELLDSETPLDTARLRTGLRTLAVSRARGLCVNGQPVKLRGACVHHDNGVLGAVSLKDAELRRARRLKAAGFNAIRSAHNPAAPALLEACDEVGLMVMDELFDCWNTSKREHDDSLFFDEWWRADMEAMVAKDVNHPCVVMYTVGNEIPETGTPGGAAQNRAMAEHFRKLDATRPVVNCVNGMFSVMPRMREILGEIVGGVERVPEDINAMMTLFDQHLGEVMRHRVVTEATEETFAGVDVCGYNYMDARYLPDGERYPNRIIVGSETNPDAIGRNWPLVCRLPYVLGDFCWTGWDYLGEAGVGKNDYELTYQMYGPWPWYLAHVGDLDICGNRRPQSYYREIVFGERQTPYIAVERPQHYQQPKYTTNWTWPDVVESWTWFGFEGKPTHVEVYADAEEVELLLNGEPLARAAVGAEMPYKALFDVAYQPGELTAVAYTGGVARGRASLTTAGKPARVRLTPEAEQAAADGQSLIYVNVELVDAEGRLVPCADMPVTLEVEGAGALVGYGSANPRSLETFQQRTRETYDGRALAVLRAGFVPGAATVRAVADGLTGDSIEVRFT